ncbi:FKBP-like peptidyl-prolyl cis-trans isomerase family protein [Perilla frutescens var. frutescens]|nr:FKBP-like peptidyl-prolyl cis-trans isomerase family protein [Perilla frutescens var. frutescens]
MREGAWPVVLQREGADCLVSITDGWSCFAHDANVRVNETIIFREITTNVFTVEIYDPNGCERGVVCPPASASHENDESNNSFCCFLLQEHLRSIGSVTKYEVRLKNVEEHFPAPKIGTLPFMRRADSPDMTAHQEHQTLRFVKRLRGYQLMHSYLVSIPRCTYVVLANVSVMGWPFSMLGSGTAEEVREGCGHGIAPTGDAPEWSWTQMEGMGEIAVQQSVGEVLHHRRMDGLREVEQVGSWGHCSFHHGTRWNGRWVHEIGTPSGHPKTAATGFAEDDTPAAVGLAAKQGWRFDSTYDHKDENGDLLPFQFVLGSGKWSTLTGVNLFFNLCDGETATVGYCGNRAEKLWFTDGWRKFATAVSFKINEVIVLKTDFRGNFFVEVYDPKGCEREVVVEQSSSTGGSVDGDPAFTYSMLAVNSEMEYKGHPRIPISYLNKHASRGLGSSFNLYSGLNNHHNDVRVELVDGEICMMQGWESFVSACDVQPHDRLTFRPVCRSMKNWFVKVYAEGGMSKFSDHKPSDSGEHEAGPNVAPTPPQTPRFVRKFSVYQIDHTYLKIPKKFVEDTGMVPLLDVQLEDGAWVRISALVGTHRNNRSVRFFLTAGWREFAHAAKLSKRDYVMFSLIRDAGNVIRIVPINHQERRNLVFLAGNGGYLVN